MSFKAQFVVLGVSACRLSHLVSYGVTHNAYKVVYASCQRWLTSLNFARTSLLPWFNFYPDLCQFKSQRLFAAILFCSEPKALGKQKHCAQGICK